MSNFDDKIKNALKQDLNLSYKYQSSIVDGIQNAIESKNGNSKENKKVKKHKFITRLSQIAAVFIIGAIGLTTYAKITGNQIFKDIGLLKLGENYVSNDNEIAKVFEDEYVDIAVANVTRDSAYMIIEYKIELKEKGLSDLAEVQYDSDDGYKIGIIDEIFINYKRVYLDRVTTEKISDSEYRCFEVIFMMDYDDEEVDLNIWLDKFYIGEYFGPDSSIKLNKDMKMKVKLESDKSSDGDYIEHRIDDNTKVVLEKVVNSNYETFIRLKRIVENVTWDEYCSNIEYYKFIVSSEDDNSITSTCYSDIGQKFYILDGGEERLVESGEYIKSANVIRAEETYVIILGTQPNLNKLKVMQTKSTFYSDRTNEEKEAYYKAKWYDLEEGEKVYTATNHLGGTLEINKITIDDDNIIFYYNKSGLFGNSNLVDIRLNDGSMNYICPVKVEEKNLNGYENKIVFYRNNFRSAGLGIKEGMLDDISKLQFTLLFGDVDEIIGEPFEVEVPNETDDKSDLENIELSDTSTVKFSYKVKNSYYDEDVMNTLEDDFVPEEFVEEKFLLDYDGRKILRSQGWMYGFGQVEEKYKDAVQLIEDIENYLKENNIEYTKEEVKSGELTVK